MTSETYYYYGEFRPPWSRQPPQWCDVLKGHGLTKDQALEKMELRKRHNPRAKLRLVRATTTIWTYRERKRAL